MTNCCGAVAVLIGFDAGSVVETDAGFDVGLMPGLLSKLMQGLTNNHLW